MAKRGPKPKGKVEIVWSPDFAYAIGLIVSDGSVRKDGRHIDFVSMEIEQIENFKKCLQISSPYSLSKSGLGKFAYRLQFSDVIFWNFLNEIGIPPAKSLVLKEINIPDEYFFDFMRGLFDGDGYSHSYWDKRWASSYQLYVGFVSAAPHFIHWMKLKIQDLSGAKGHITRAYKRNVCYQLRYSTHEAVKVIEKMYGENHTCLSRKKLKIYQSLAMIKPRRTFEETNLTK